MNDQPTPAEIKADTEELIHQADVNPTNAELLEGQQQIKQMFAAHAEDDHVVATAQAVVNASQMEVNLEVQSSLAGLHAWKDTVATKEDIKEMLDFMKQIDIGVGIFKFSWNNAAKIGSFLLLIVGVFIFFKMGLAAALTFVLGKEI